MWGWLRKSRSNGAAKVTPPLRASAGASPATATWWSRWRRPKGQTAQDGPRDPSAAPPSSFAKVLHFEGVKYFFGLDWRMIPPTRRLSRALAMARKEGQFWYVTSELGDLAGFLKKPKWLRGRHYVASLHLASRFSQGGLELFVFVFPDERHGVLALQESRPLPGMDHLTDETSARLMVEEFLAIQRGQPIRLVGNTTWLEGQETMAPEDVFAEPVRSAALRSLHSGRVLTRLFVLVTLAAGGFYFGSEFIEDQRRETLMELQNSPAHQQKQYREGLARAWTKVGPEANEVLQTWYAMLSKVPLHHHGWGLQRIACEVSQCKVHWLRGHGSYEDFLQHLPVGAQGVDESVSSQESVATKIVTLHPLAFEKTVVPVLEEFLPNAAASRRKLGDLFQDLQLLGKGQVLIEPPRLFGGDQDPQFLKGAVYSGKWSLRHQLWILPTLTLPRFARVQNLLVELRPESKSDASGAAKSLAPISTPEFELSGSYYAKN